MRNLPKPVERPEAAAKNAALPPDIRKHPDAGKSFFSLQIPGAKQAYEAWLVSLSERQKEELQYMLKLLTEGVDEPQTPEEEEQSRKDWVELNNLTPKKH